MSERKKIPEDGLRILTPIGMLGYGIHEGDFEQGLENNPDAIILDSGSNDGGPFKLGANEMARHPDSYERDLRLLLDGRAKNNIPLLIGSSGGPGTNELVREVCSLVETHEANEGRETKVAYVYSDVDKDTVRERLEAGEIEVCDGAPDLENDDIDDSIIVAQIGAEPILKVLEENEDIDVIVAGRAYDPSPYAAFCMQYEIDPGIYWHMGKIMECGGLCAEPKTQAIMATVFEDSFELEPLSKKAKCTPTSVAAHTLYEKMHPYKLQGPGGMLDLEECDYIQMSGELELGDPSTKKEERRVKVTGSRFVKDDIYRVKLEGAKQVGYRSMFIGGIRDPIMIEGIDDILETIKSHMVDKHKDQSPPFPFEINFHLYGRNGVMSKWEPVKDIPHEIGLLCEVTAPEQEFAAMICSETRVAMLHGPYQGQLATGGNLASPLTPLECDLGAVYKWSVYHTMIVRPGEGDELFKCGIYSEEGEV